MLCVVSCCTQVREAVPNVELYIANLKQERPKRCEERGLRVREDMRPAVNDASYPAAASTARAAYTTLRACSEGEPRQRREGDAAAALSSACLDAQSSTGEAVAG
jgi:hypothetical protein